MHLHTDECRMLFLRIENNLFVFIFLLPIFKLFWAKKTQWTHDSRRVCARAPAHFYTYLYRDQFWLHFAWIEIMAMMWICNNVHQAKYEVAHLSFFVHVKYKDILLTAVWMHLRSDLHAIDVYIYKLINRCVQYALANQFKSSILREMNLRWWVFPSCFSVQPIHYFLWFVDFSVLIRNLHSTSISNATLHTEFLFDLILISGNFQIIKSF